MSSPEPLEELAPAKVNLFLHVVGRRADGYHLLDSVAVFPGAGDIVRASPAPTLTLSIEGPCGRGLDAGDENLVLRAARGLAEAMGIRMGARLVLDKRLPVASGIGGGSADAAATLRVLARLWSGDVSPPRVQAIALGLGADVPVCIASRPARMQGVGEVLAPAPALPPHGMVLVNPGVAVSTPDVFRGRAGAFSAPAALPARWNDARDMAAGLALLRNDLEDAAAALCPAITEVLTWLRAEPGCLLARMSGSGATCFGLFADGAAAVAASHRVPAPWWRWGGAAARSTQAFTDPSRTP